MDEKCIKTCVKDNLDIVSFWLPERKRERPVTIDTLWIPKNRDKLILRNWKSEICWHVDMLILYLNIRKKVPKAHLALTHGWNSNEKVKAL